ncbi:cytochrome b561 [Raineyella antarctica]|uniref:Cytochrome b561 n=1 Tax=Raineyella antarctica TaxID=1577474 RepID=A0A1G6IKV5_9ACTN|nr:molybdopterin-dependent oxidoreductase [Raineyella antarctica]SDC07073.1 cytochrome b561 [Raineyella antarctica]
MLVPLDFPLWLRATHLVNFILIGLLIRSGWEIIASHPRLYWKNNCTPGSEWIRFTKDKVPTEVGAYTARDDQRSWSPLLVLPGNGKIAMGRAWHGLVTSLWVLNGAVYVTLLFATGEWHRIVPTSWSVFPQAWDSMRIYLGFGIPGIEHFTPYDSLQRLMYFFVVFVFAPFMMLTGPVMSPAVVGRFPWYPKLFGGRQAARSLHFLAMIFISFFIVVHVSLVFVVHPTVNLPQMAFGVRDEALFAQALTTVLFTILGVVLLWIALSYLTLIDLRRSQRVLWGATAPVRRLLLDRFSSHQAAAHTFTERDISPFHWVNTRTPAMEESAEWHQLRADDFRDFRLEVGGQTRDAVSYSLEQLRNEFHVREQITMHTCMQGWTGIAKWTGVRVRDLLDTVEPLEGARYVMFESFGKAQHMHDGRPVEPYYTVLPMDVAREEETILAWGMNGDAIPDMYGAPLRLRVESMHGYKMVKWVRSVSLIRDYHQVGDGQGGTREDSGYQHIDARI